MMSELTKAIGTHGVNWNVADREGNTPLHLCDSPDHMAVLLQADVNPNATNKVNSAQPNPPPFSTATTTTNTAATVNTTSSTTTTTTTDTKHHLHLRAQHNSLTLTRRCRSTLLPNHRPAKRPCTHPSHPS